MHEKDYSVSLLLDFYGEVLTEKQREVIELYYDEDLSLAEIAEHAGITRQGVRDCIQRGEHVLRDMESRLKLAARFSRVREELAGIVSAAQEIADYNARYCGSQKIDAAVRGIVQAAERLRDET